MKKQTKFSKIISLLQSGKSPKDVAKELKIPVQSVYTAKYIDRQRSKSLWNGKKKVGRPRKLQTVTVSATNNPLISKVILEDRVESLQIEIANLKHQIVGFRAVISYLEDLAGIRDSQ